MLELYVGDVRTPITWRMKIVECAAFPSTFQSFDFFKRIDLRDLGRLQFKSGVELRFCEDENGNQTKNKHPVHSSIAFWMFVS